MGDLPSRTRGTTMLDLAIRCVDLTSLEGTETPDFVRSLCARAVRPDPDDETIPSVAAVVLYPRMIPVAAEVLKGTSVHLAGVAGFPEPSAPLAERLDEVRGAVESGADEVDIVLNRAARPPEAVAEIELAREAAGSAALKVILETGELGSDQRIREAAMLAMSAGADFIKSSTGKVGTGATREAALAMMEAVRDFHAKTERAVGVKVSGGIRTADAALGYLELLEGTLGREWLTPERFRIGASALLEDLVGRLREADG